MTQTKPDVWRYRFYQMQNGKPGYTAESWLFDLPINGVTFSTKIDDVGTFTGTVEQSNPAVQTNLLGMPPWHLLLERTALYVDLNGSLVWGGILTQANYQRSTQQVQIQAQDWWGYFYNSRIITWDASYGDPSVIVNPGGGAIITGKSVVAPGGSMTIAASPVDQLLIAADLMNIAQGHAGSTAPYVNNHVPAGRVTGGNVGVALGTTCQQALAGTLTSYGVVQGWAASDQKPVGQAISDLASGDIGFDWTIDVAYDSNGNPTKTFNLWYPRAGRTANQQAQAGNAITFYLGGTSGQDYSWPTGVNPPANQVLASGSGAAAGTLNSEASIPALLDQGWPLTELAVSWTDVQDQNILDALTRSTLDAVQLPVASPEIWFNAGRDSSQPLGSFGIGDDCRLIIDPDPYFMFGYDAAGGEYGEIYWRIVEIDVTVKDEGKSQMHLVLDRPPRFVPPARAPIPGPTVTEGQTPGTGPLKVGGLPPFYPLAQIGISQKTGLTGTVGPSGGDTYE